MRLLRCSKGVSRGVFRPLGGLPNSRAGLGLLEAGQLGGLVIGREVVGPLEQGLQGGRDMGAEPEPQMNCGLKSFFQGFVI